MNLSSDQIEYLKSIPDFTPEQTLLLTALAEEVVRSFELLELVQKNQKTSTQPPSPAGQAVMDAAKKAQQGSCYIQFEQIAAAALRAAADKAPAPHRHEEMAFHSGFWAGIEYIRSIAIELEGK